METKKTKGINLFVFILIIVVIVICLVYFFTYKSNKDENNQNKIESGSQNNYLQEETKSNTNAKTISDTSSNQSSSLSDSSNSDQSSNVQATDIAELEDIKYEMSSSENIVTIKATKGDETVTKDFEMNDAIADTDTMILPTIGSVALVADAGGEYYGVTVFQLVNGDIKKIGTIDCGANMVKDATYEVGVENDESTVVITANVNGKSIKKEFEMDAKIAETDVIDIFNCGKVVLVAETGGEFYLIKVFRLSQDYTSGEIQDIIEAGSIEYDG